MSADNYYTVKFNTDDLLWYVVHGSMSALEDGYPATVHPEAPGYVDYDTAKELAWSLAHDGYGAEYGVIEEPGALKTLVTNEHVARYAREQITKWTEWLEWTND